MEALQEWIEREGFITTCDFSTKDEESTFYHSHSMKNKPYLSLSDYYKILYEIIRFLKELIKWAFIGSLICINSPRE